jgi:hypothetical protein
VDNDFDLAEGFERLLEKLFNIRGLRHIRLHGDTFPTAALDLGYNCFSFCWVTGKVDYDGEAIAGESLCHHTSDSA